MNMIVKLIIGLVAAAIWVAAVIGKHFWPDLDTGAIVLACGSVLSGLGVYHVATPAVAPAPKAEGGFALLTLLIVVAGIAGVLGLTGCAGTFGHSSITVKANAVGTHDLDIKDGKEYANGRTVKFSAKSGELLVDEGPSKAFKGQALGVKAINILPTMGLGDILAPQDH